MSCLALPQNMEVVFYVIHIISHQDCNYPIKKECLSHKIVFCLNSYRRSLCIWRKGLYNSEIISNRIHTHTHTWNDTVNNLGQIDINISVILIIILLHMWDTRDTCENILTSTLNKLISQVKNVFVTIKSKTLKIDHLALANLVSALCPGRLTDMPAI